MIEIKDQSGATVYEVFNYTINNEDMGKSSLVCELSLPVQYENGIEVPVSFDTKYYVNYGGDMFYLNSNKPTGVKDNESQNIKYTLFFESKRNILDNTFVKNVAYVY